MAAMTDYKAIDCFGLAEANKKWSKVFHGESGSMAIVGTLLTRSSNAITELLAERDNLKAAHQILLDICDSPADVLAKQNAELLAEIEALKGLLEYPLDDVDSLITNLEAERDKLRAALEKYGRHTNRCERVAEAFIGNHVNHDAKCTCGLKDVLRQEN